MNDQTSIPSQTASARLKAAALSLFAERGIDGVSVRDIAQAAGQRNHASVKYHFGSKDALIAEIILDGAVLIDGRRNAMLDKMEASGGPHLIKDIARALVLPAVDFAPEGEMRGFHRFYMLMEMTYRERLLEILNGKLNSGHLRCLDHLRTMMPDMPKTRQTQKFIFIERYTISIIAGREAMLENPERSNSFWNEDATIEHFVESVVAMIEA